MSAVNGRDVLLEFAIAPETTAIGSLPAFSRLGMLRTKDGPNVAWDKADTTADMSPAYTKTSLVTFKEVTLGGDGIAYDDAAYNQKVLKAHVANPGSSTGNQPKVWFRVTEPDGSQWIGPFLIDSWDSSAPYDGPATFSFSSTSNGAVTYTPT